MCVSCTMFELVIKIVLVYFVRKDPLWNLTREFVTHSCKYPNTTGGHEGDGDVGK